jgi:23S rRNA (cytidine2498-2'-O)-methyltransferase
MAMPGVRFQKHDAFTLSPGEIGPLDWLFSDVICYPRRLYEWIEKWLNSGFRGNFVCTIKMQGEWDAETTRLFAAIPGGVVVHLYHNKHELTWIKIGPR